MVGSGLWAPAPGAPASLYSTPSAAITDWTCTFSPSSPPMLLLPLGVSDGRLRIIRGWCGPRAAAPAAPGGRVAPHHTAASVSDSGRACGRPTPACAPHSRSGLRCPWRRAIHQQSAWLRRPSGHHHRSAGIPRALRAAASYVSRGHSGPRSVLRTSRRPVEGTLDRPALSNVARCRAPEAQARGWWHRAAIVNAQHCAADEQTALNARCAACARTIITAAYAEIAALAAAGVDVCDGTPVGVAHRIHHRTSADIPRRHTPGGIASHDMRPVPNHQQRADHRAVDHCWLESGGRRLA